MINSDSLNFFFKNFRPRNIVVPTIEQLNQDPLLEQGEIHLKLSESLFIVRKNETHSFDSIRMNWFIDFLIKSLSTYPVKNLNCELILNLSDGCGNYDFSKLCFSQKRGYKNILIPDPHNINTFVKIQQLSKIDIPFEDKKDLAIFIGSATGQPIENDLNLRELSAINNTESRTSKIKIIPVSGYAEKDMLEKKLKAKNLNFDIFSDYVSIEEQLKYKIIFTADGHTTSWERPLWIMASNSLCLNIKPHNIFESWYSDLFSFYQAIPDIDLYSIDLFIENSNIFKEGWSSVKQKQKTLANSVSSLHNQMLYMSNVIKYYNEQFNLR